MRRKGYVYVNGAGVQIAGVAMGGSTGGIQASNTTSLCRAPPAVPPQAMTLGRARWLLTAALTLAALLRSDDGGVFAAPLAPQVDAPLPAVVRICVQAYTPFVVQRVRRPAQPACLSEHADLRLHLHRTGMGAAWRRWPTRRASRSLIA